jgi:hypothetical protein
LHLAGVQVQERPAAADLSVGVRGMGFPFGTRRKGLRTDARGREFFWTVGRTAERLVNPAL